MHSHPVHFNRGRHGSVWICISCGKQLMGPKLPDDEREALTVFAELFSNEMKARKGITAVRQEEIQMEGIQLTFSFKEGTPPTDMAAKLRFHAGLLEGMPAKTAASRKNTDAPVKAAPEPEIEDEESEDEDFAPAAKKTKAKAAAASFDDEDEETEAVESEDEEEVEEAPKKKTAAKAKKVTLDDANDACKAHAAENGLKATKALLKKKFGTDTLSEVKPDKYAAVVAAMAV